ncbi:PIG-L family deacetylase [bacterium]|nr:PIG-L family deacetylase [bacterium]QQR59909.1 MAG: PIG-L family deacetylase [Candidatus Melainabacteria bacterium]
MSEKVERNQILIIAAHPDDEILGAGATMAKHAASGDDVYVLIVAQGATSRYSSDSNLNEAEDYVSNLKACAQAAAKALGTNSPNFLGFPDNKLDTVALLDIVQKIEEFINTIRPKIIYTHHGGDLNIDHQIVHRAVLTATRPIPNAFVKSIYTFETVSSTEWSSPQQQQVFIPTRFVNVTQMFEKKLQALAEYKSEMREFPHARSVEAVEALARVRGAASGSAMAEAFAVIRELVD